jgi:hypothetical protein
MMRMGRYRRKIAIAVALAACVAAILIIARPREEIADPAVLAKMPLGELRDSEIETLIRSALRNADRVIVNGWGPQPKGGQELVITDRSTLNALAENFSVGRDSGQPKPFFCPKLAYSTVRCQGAIEPILHFADEQMIYIWYSRRASDSRGPPLAVGAEFGKLLAELLSLDRGPRDN